MTNSKRICRKGETAYNSPCSVSVPLGPLAFILFYCFASKCPPDKSTTSDWWEVSVHSSPSLSLPPPSVLISTISLTANYLLSTSTAKSPSLGANLSETVALNHISLQVAENCVAYSGPAFQTLLNECVKYKSDLDCSRWNYFLHL